MSTKNARWLIFLFVVLPIFGASGFPQEKKQVASAKAVRHPAKGLLLETIAWMTDGAEFLDKRRFKTSLTKTERTFDRGALLDGALARAADEDRLVLWYVYKISESTKRGRQMIRAPILDIAMRQIIWSDPDISRIVTANFVPLRMVCDEPMSKRFDLRPLKFLEPSIVVMKPSGEVVHILRTIRTFDTSWFAHFLRDILRKAKGALISGDIPKALDRGEWGMALDLEIAGKGQDPESLLRRAVLLRKQRDGESALAMLEQCETAWDDALKAVSEGMTSRKKRRFERAAKKGAGRFGPKEANAFAAVYRSIQAERGLIQARLGDFAGATSTLQNVADANAGEESAQAAYLLALLRLRRGDEMGASRRFQEIVQAYPQTISGRRAKANVILGIGDNRPIGAAFSGIERIAWLPESSYTTLPKDTTWPQEKLEIATAITFGVRFLLSQQRANGGWNDSRYAYCPDPRITPNVWVAVTALSCQALLRHRGAVDSKMQKSIDDALWRGDRYLADTMNMNRGRNEDVYADAYRLEYYAHKLSSLGDDKARSALRVKILKIIRAAGDRQKKGGFWAHEYANAFCTAVMAQGLLAVRAEGVAVPDAMLEAAKEAIASGRYENGAFSYGGKARGKGNDKRLKNASTRMPLCEGVLMSLGGSNEEKLGFAFRTFWQHIDRIEGVRRTDFHSDGEIAGFMFFHTLYHTSRAIEALPAAERPEQQARLLDRVLHYGEIDGTFMDSHELGRSYGTAMALLVIANTMPVLK